MSEAERRRKISAAMKGNKNAAGHKVSREGREAISRAQRARHAARRARDASS